MTRRPNILLLISDEHDPAVLGCYGDAIVETPNIDGLASQGVTFDACYTPSPICVPARLSITAGKYISRCGAWSNTCWLPSDDYPSLPRIMNAAGYDSILCGKMHYDSTRRYGFRDVLPPQPHLNSWFKSGKGGRRKLSDATPEPPTSTKSTSYRLKNFHTGDKSWVMDLDKSVTNYTSDFLKARQSEDKPFFLLAGYTAPHFPLIVPEEYFNRYKDRVPAPTIPEGHIESLAPNYQCLRNGFGLQDISDEETKKGRELYWAFVDWLDDQIGQVLTALEDSEVANNTIVIYTSDHGENKGDHGFWWKNTMFEASSRVPLIVSWPGRYTGGERRTETCSLLDLMQTIADWGCADTPDDWNGSSLRQLLQGHDEGWKDFAVSEYYAHFVETGYTMFRKGRFKYVYHVAAEEDEHPFRELYDLKSDPQEFRNLALEGGHEARMADLHEQMVMEIGRTPEEAEAECLASYKETYNREPTEELTKLDPTI